LKYDKVASHKLAVLLRKNGLGYAVVKAFTQGEGKGEISPSQNLGLALGT